MAKDVSPGGVAMIEVGQSGADIRGDARVTVQDGSGIRVTSTIADLYGPQIQWQAKAVLAQFGSPTVQISIDDTGALPFVLEARIEAALSAFLSVPLPELPPREGAGRSLRRTRLYVPGSVPKMMPGAGLYRPDVLILDLEDSVRPADKIAARALVRRALHALDWPGCERAVRINTGPTGLDDIRAVARQGVDLLLMPKCESPKQILEVAALLDELGASCEILAFLETALGVVRCYEIASASPRVTALSLGLEDYLADIGAERSESGLESQFAMGQVVNSARAAGIQPLASVYSRIDDEKGLFEFARRAKSMGYQGISCIHPRQIRTVHEAFRPSESEVIKAQAIVDSFESASQGAISVDGQMVDEPIYRRALETLRRAEVSR